MTLLLPDAAQAFLVEKAAEESVSESVLAVFAITLVASYFQHLDRGAGAVMLFEEAGGYSVVEQRPGIRLLIAHVSDTDAGRIAAHAAELRVLSTDSITPDDPDPPQLRLV